jgi:hypothetical protein
MIFLMCANQNWNLTMLILLKPENITAWWATEESQRCITYTEPQLKKPTASYKLSKSAKNQLIYEADLRKKFKAWSHARNC